MQQQHNSNIKEMICSNKWETCGKKRETCSGYLDILVTRILFTGIINLSIRPNNLVTCLVRYASVREMLAAPFSLSPFRMIPVSSFML